MPRSGLTGEVKLVFDDSGSSTVRYMRDSLCNGQELKGNLYAQGSNPAVIETVKSDPTVIGVVGTNWLKGDRDSAMNSFEGLDVKVLKVSRENTEDAIGWKPYQYRILTGDYPLIRSVYVMTTDPRVRSNVKTLFFFMKGQKGQTIIATVPRCCLTCLCKINPSISTDGRVSAKAPFGKAALRINNAKKASGQVNCEEKCVFLYAAL